MIDQINAVRDFHKKQGFNCDGEKREDPTDENKALLRKVSNVLLINAKQMEKHLRSTAQDDIMRSCLMVEELGELLGAMAAGDEVLVLDGITDLLYVVFGTGIARWPKAAELMSKAFNEVQRSNMSKGIATDDNPRLRDKGPDYSPADLKKVFQDHIAANSKLFVADEVHTPKTETTTPKKVEESKSNDSAKG